MAKSSEWRKCRNSRGYEYMRCEKNHVALSELKKNEDLKLHNTYLSKRDIPDYPDYVFEEANVCHVTELSGLEGILKDGGFKRSDKDFKLWWSLLPPKQCQNMNQFQEEFATSPAFKTKSLYGNFCFTFPFRELLREYSELYDYSCPILRVFDTKVYKNEIVYSILVHPKYMWHYWNYPRLPTDAKQVCGYDIKEKKIVWSCQSPSSNYKYGMQKDAEDGQNYITKLNNEKYFVWDNVAVVFHMKWNKLLKFGHKQLFKHLTVCETASGNLLREPKLSIEKAEEEVRRLKLVYNVK